MRTYRWSRRESPGGCSGWDRDYSSEEARQTHTSKAYQGRINNPKPNTQSMLRQHRTTVDKDHNFVCAIERASHNIPLASTIELQSNFRSTDSP